MRIFQVSRWDAIPAILTVVQFGLLVLFALSWWHLSWSARIGYLALYAFSVGWNLNSIAHNFIHNPFFSWRPANRLIAYLLSWALLTPQTMYRNVHTRHHIGNGDRPGPDGTSIDPLSIYQYGGDGLPEPCLPYVFLQFLRDESPFALARRIAVKHPKEAREALWEFWSMVIVWGIFVWLAWPFALLAAFASYLGQCLSNLSGYYEHLGSNPDVPIAWGVSTYEPIYNFVFMNNGYHGEHHYRPKHHWTKMKELREAIAVDQAIGGMMIIRPPHILGFFEPKTWNIPVKAKK